MLGLCLICSRLRMCLLTASTKSESTRSESSGRPSPHEAHDSWASAQRADSTRQIARHALQLHPGLRLIFPSLLHVSFSLASEGASEVERTVLRAFANKSVMPRCARRVREIIVINNNYYYYDNYDNTQFPVLEILSVRRSRNSQRFPSPCGSTEGWSSTVERPPASSTSSLLHGRPEEPALLQGCSLYGGHLRCVKTCREQRVRPPT